MIALEPASVASARWVEDGKAARFSSPRGYGVRTAAGTWLSFDGVRPYVVTRKSTAAEVASTIVDDGSLRFVGSVA